MRAASRTVGKEAFFGKREGGTPDAKKTAKVIIFSSAAAASSGFKAGNFAGTGIIAQSRKAAYALARLSNITFQKTKAFGLANIMYFSPRQRSTQISKLRRCSIILLSCTSTFPSLMVLLFSKIPKCKAVKFFWDTEVAERPSFSRLAFTFEEKFGKFTSFKSANKILGLGKASDASESAAGASSSNKAKKVARAMATGVM